MFILKDSIKLQRNVEMPGISFEVCFIFTFLTFLTFPHFQKVKAEPGMNFDPFS